jgi:hypothetical protein
MMNCEEYKLAIAAEPASDGGAAHVAVCDECQEYGADMQALDHKIAQALDIAVPAVTLPELPELDTANVATLPPVRRSLRAPTWMALAATVLVATFVGVKMTSVDGPHASLGEQLLAHMDHEPYALRVSGKAVSDQRLARVVPANIATMTHDAGLITYAQSCEINGRNVPHLVIQGEKGPITILLMPEEAVSGIQTIDGESVQGLIFPVGGGSIAIIGEKEEQLDEVKQSILNSVTWVST